MTENNIRENLEILPNKISKKETELLEMNKKVEEMIAIKKSTELSVFNDVADDVDEEKKKKFPNDSKRKAETERRLSLSSNYQVNIKEMNELKEKIKFKEIDLNFLKRTFRATEAITRMGE